MIEVTESPEDLVEECIEYTLLVKLLARDKGESLIELPDEILEREQAGSDLVKVLKVADNAWTDKGYTKENRPLNPGDYAMFQRYAGIKLPRLDPSSKEDLRLAKDQEFVCRLDKTIVEKYFKVQE